MFSFTISDASNSVTNSNSTSVSLDMLFMLIVVLRESKQDQAFMFQCTCQGRFLQVIAYISKHTDHLSSVSQNLHRLFLHACCLLIHLCAVLPEDVIASSTQIFVSSMNFILYVIALPFLVYFWIDTKTCCVPLSNCSQAIKVCFKPFS